VCGTLAQGCKDPRLDGDEHMEAVEEFCLSAQKQWPNCLIQFEDFPTDKVPAVARSQTIPTLKGYCTAWLLAMCNTAHTGHYRVCNPCTVLARWMFATS